MTEGQFEQAKGRAKEAVGEVTDDKELELEGQAEQASGATKSKFAELIDKLKRPFRRQS